MTTSTRSQSAATTRITPAWESALFGYELAAQAHNLSPRSIANRRSSITGLARWLATEHDITSPDQVTKLHMQLAMKRAYGDREKSGVRTCYNDQKAFWDWYAAEEGTQSPLACITRPKDVVVPVNVLSDKENPAPAGGSGWPGLAQHPR